MQSKPRRSKLTADQAAEQRAYLLAALDTLRMNQAELAAALATPYRTMQHWVAGSASVPGVARVAIDMLVSSEQKKFAKVNKSH